MAWTVAVSLGWIDVAGAVEPVDGLRVTGSAGESIVRLTDFISPGDLSTSPFLYGALGDHVLFSGSNDGDFFSRSLWAATGEAVDPVATRAPLPSPIVRDADQVLFQGEVFFRTSSSSVSGRVWAFNGATAGPAGLMETEHYVNAAVFGDRLYYSRNQQLRSYDGVSLDTVDTPAGVSVRRIEHAGEDRLFFMASQPGLGTELWTLENGVASLFDDLNPDNGSSSFTDEVVFRDNLYFVGGPSGAGNVSSLWRVDDLAMTRVSPDGLSLREAVVFQDEIYLVGNDGSGIAMWRYDGQRFEQAWSPGLDPFVFVSNLVPHNGVLYSLSNDRVHGEEIWAWDGHEARLVADLNPGPSGIMGGDPFDLQFTTVGGSLYFAPVSAPGRAELWVLTPIPEPATAAALLAATGLLATGRGASLRRRRTTACNRCSPARSLRVRART